MRRVTRRTMAVHVRGLLTVLILVGAMVGCSQVSQDNVAVIGDSISAITEPQIREALEGHEVIMKATNNMEVAEMQGEADSLLVDPPKQVVIELGTNDVLHGKPVAAASASLEAMAAKFGSSECVHLVLVNESMFSMTADLGTPSKQLNQFMRDLATRKGYRIVDWAKITADYIARGEPDGRLTVDTVHPDEVGKRLLAGAVSDSVKAC